MDNGKTLTLKHLDNEDGRINATENNSKGLLCDVIVEEDTCVIMLLKTLYATLYILIFMALNLKYKCIYTY